MQMPVSKITQINLLMGRNIIGRDCFPRGYSEKDGKTQTIEVRVGSSTIYVYAYVEAGNEKLLQSISIPNAFDETKSYVLDYSKKGVFDFWQNGSRIFNQFDLSAAGFTNIKPALGLGAEVCSFHTVICT